MFYVDLFRLFLFGSLFYKPHSFIYQFHLFSFIISVLCDTTFIRFDLFIPKYLIETHDDSDKSFGVDFICLLHFGYLSLNW
jgi:hypothetical protein